MFCTFVGMTSLTLNSKHFRFMTMKFDENAMKTLYKAFCP